MASSKGLRRWAVQVLPRPVAPVRAGSLGASHLPSKDGKTRQSNHGGGAPVTGPHNYISLPFNDLS